MDGGGLPRGTGPGVELYWRAGAVVLCRARGVLDLRLMACLDPQRCESMKRSKWLVVWLVLAVAGLCQGQEAGLIPDKNLEAVLRQQVYEKRNTDKPLTEEDLKKVHIVDAGVGKKIASLNGIEKCTNLLQLRLSKNEIVDVTPLKDLTSLQSLDLAGNKIVDVAPLAGLVKLQYLELSDNQIESVAPLAGLVKLSALYLSGNKISDLAPLGGLTNLASLYLDGNAIADIAPLATVNKLSSLDLRGNQIVDLAPLSKQTQLRMLLVDRNKIADLAPLVALAKADAEGDRRLAPYLNLYLAGNPLSDAAKSAQLEALKQCGVRVKLEPTK